MRSGEDGHQKEFVIYSSGEEGAHPTMQGHVGEARGSARRQKEGGEVWTRGFTVVFAGRNGAG